MSDEPDPVDVLTATTLRTAADVFSDQVLDDPASTVDALVAMREMTRGDDALRSSQQFAELCGHVLIALAHRSQLRITLAFDRGRYEGGRAA